MKKPYLASNYPLYIFLLSILLAAPSSQHQIPVTDYASTNDFSNARVAAFSSTNRFVVVWQQDTTEILAQQFDDTGVPTSIAVPVNPSSTFSQKSPAVATFSNGNYIVVWAIDEEDGDSEGVYAQILDSNNDPVGNKFRVNEETTGNQTFPSVAVFDSNNYFIVVWQQFPPDSWDIYGRVFEEDGTAYGGEFQISGPDLQDQEYPQVSTFPGSDQFIVVYTSKESANPNTPLIEYAIYDQSGSQVSRETVITGTVGNPDVVVFSTGDFAITWDEFVDAQYDYDIFFAKYAANETVEISPVVVNSNMRVGGQELPSIARFSNDDYLIVFEDATSLDGDLRGIYAQKYQSNGATFGFESQVNYFHLGTQAFADVAVTANDNAIIVWESDGESNYQTIQAQIVGCAPVYSLIDGTCEPNCSELVDHITEDQYLQPFCQFQCLQNDLSIHFWRTDDTCIEICEDPMAITDDSPLSKHCEFPCPEEDDIYYMQGPPFCSKECIEPKIKDEATFPFTICSHPCNENVGYFYDPIEGQCFENCHEDYNINTNDDINICEHPCPSQEDLYYYPSNNSCLAECNAPHTPFEKSAPGALNYCNHPCPSFTEYFNTYDSSCIGATCFEYYIESVDGDIKYCESPCLTPQYWVASNETCQLECESPFSQENILGQGEINLCVHPCGDANSDQFFYPEDASCQPTCTFPYVQNLIKENYKECYSQCEDPLLFAYHNGSCLATCDEPLKSKIEQGLQICVQTCASFQDFFWFNQICLDTCPQPLIQDIESDLKVCNHPCGNENVDQFYFASDEKCDEDCIQPTFKTRVVDGVKRCESPCDEDQYVMPNGTCLDECGFPLRPYEIHDIQICEHPCENQKDSSSLYYFQNGSCFSECNLPYTSTKISGVNFCNNTCDNHSDCESPFFPNCDARTKECHACSSNLICIIIYASNAPLCQLSSGMCVQCFENANCTNLDSSKCVDNFCEECQTDEDCVHFNTEIFEYKCIQGECQGDEIAEQKAARTLGTTASSVTASIAVATFALSSNPLLIYLFTAILQKYYYLLLINTAFPEFLRTFFKSFSFTRLSFLVFIFSGMEESSSIEPFENFEKMGFDGNYIINTGGIIVALAIILLVLKALSILVRKLKTPKLQDKFKKVYDLVFWKGTFIFLSIFVMEFIITSFLQLVSSPIEGLSGGLGIILALVTIVFYLIFGYKVFIGVREFYNQGSSKSKYTQRKDKATKKQSVQGGGSQNKNRVFRRRTTGLKLMAGSSETTQIRKESSNNEIGSKQSMKRNKKFEKYFKAFIVQPKALKPEYRSNFGMNTRWQLKYKMCLTLGIRFFSALAYPCFYHRAVFTIAVQVLSELMMLILNLSCWKFMDKWCSLMEITNQVTMISLLSVISILLGDDGSRKIELGRVIIGIAFSGLFITIIFALPGIIGDLRKKIKAFREKRKGGGDSKVLQKGRRSLQQLNENK